MGLKRIQCVSDVMAQWGEFSCFQAGFCPGTEMYAPKSLKSSLMVLHDETHGDRIPVSIELVPLSFTL